MSRTCPCSRPAGDGFICGICTDLLAGQLRTVPVYLAEELDTTLAKLTAFGETGTRPQHPPARWPDETPDHGAAERPLPYSPTVSEAGWVLHNTLAAWAAALMENRGHHSPVDGLTEQGQGERMHVHGPAVLSASLAVLAAYLSANIQKLRMRPDAWDAAGEIGSAIALVDRLVDAPVHRTVVTVSGCPEPDCAGEVRAYIPTHHDRTSYMACTACRRRWESWQWGRFRRRAQKATIP